MSSPSCPTSAARLLPRFRSPKRLHWAIVLILSVALLVVYYAHGNSLPHSSDSWWGWFWSVFFFEYRHEALGLLLALPMLYATLALGWEKALILMIGLVACATPYIVDFSHRPAAIATSLVFMILPPVLLMSTELKLTSDAKERLNREERRRQAVAIKRQRIRSQEDERQRISHELHDGVAQNLLVIATTAHSLIEREALDEAARKDLETIREGSLGLVAELRAICQNLRPSALDSLGLESALKWLVGKFQEETGLCAELAVSELINEIDAEASLAVYRVCQEALSNVKKHAQASRVRVALVVEGSWITVSIEDDGIGFDPKARVNSYALDGRLGLLGMSERIEAIDGRLHITSAKGSGTRVTVSCPFDTN